jgi:hypothetical protein
MTVASCGPLLATANWKLAVEPALTGPDGPLYQRQVRGRRNRRERHRIVVVGEVGLEAEDSGERQGVTREREVVHLGAGAVGSQVLSIVITRSSPGPS